jgi:hypothetical protein
VRPFFLIYSAAIVGLEIALLRGAVIGQIDVASGVVVQLFIASVTFIFGCALRRQPDVAGRFLHLALWTALAGPYGAVIGATLGLTRWTPPPVNFPSLLEAETDPGDLQRLRLLRSDLCFGRLRIDGASDVTASNSVFREGKRGHKLDALSAIGRKFGPDLSQSLRLGAADADPSVRALAFAVKAKVKREMAHAVDNFDRFEDRDTALDVARLTELATGGLGHKEAPRHE